MNNFKLYNSDCRHMSELADNSIQCVVTSPPYWGLRKYAGLPDIVWGGDNNCRHEWVTKESLAQNQQTGDNGFKRPWRDIISTDRRITENTCSICGAWKGQFGLEPTIELYIQHTLEIMRECKRVLRPDGVVFWNIGDSYASGFSTSDNKYKAMSGAEQALRLKSCTKPKDLCLIPFRVALAAQADGWWVRSDIIWNKPNPMPESVTDRPTDAYEPIFMFTKSARYYWDAEAVKEPANPETQRGSNCSPSEPDDNSKDEWRSHMEQNRHIVTSRNLRNVWTFPTQPYKGAHFATFPEALPEKCIKAATKEGDIVLDPFAGSGTTLWVARKLGRLAVGYELSGKYCRLIEKRNAQAVLA
jgi:site-specific DNA-methyltransferase (adenine-specific)